MLTLLEVPKAAHRNRKTQVYRYGRGKTHELRTRKGFISWPAEWNDRFLTVLISLRELARFADQPFPMNERQITASLKKHEMEIENRAEQAGLPLLLTHIVLGDGSLTRKRRRRTRPSAESSYSGPSLECYATPSAKKRRRAREANDFVRTGW